MIVSIIIRLWNHFRNDSLFRNSIYLMASTGVMAVLGFIFWIFMARLFPTKDVGIATTLISVMTLISNVCLLGFNMSLIRYLPKSTNRNEKINSVVILISVAAVIVTAAFIIGLKIFSPHLLFLQTNYLYILSFIIFTVGAALNTVGESVFLAYRASSNILVKSTILSIFKLLLPIFFVFLGSYGIFTSIGLATLISTIVSFIILVWKYDFRPSLTLHIDEIRKMAVFSGGNYISSFLSQAPNLILPLFIINRLSAETAAYFYVDMMILGFLTIITTSTTQSLLAEGSYDDTKFRDHFLKAAKTLYGFLIPAIMMIVFFGNIILRAFGKNFASDAFTFLQLISISVIFMSISSLGNVILRVRHDMKNLILINILSVVLVLGFAYLLIDKGLVGIGFGWILGRGIVSLVYIALYGRDIAFKKKHFDTALSYTFEKLRLNF